MPAHFHGSLDELKDRLLLLDLDGDWEAQPNQVWKLKCRDRAGMLWSQTKGTVWYDGPQAPKDALAAKVDAVLADSAAPAAVPAGSAIFVVHGRDTESRDQLELVLRRLGLEPFVLQVTGGGGSIILSREIPQRSRDTDRSTRSQNRANSEKPGPPGLAFRCCGYDQRPPGDEHLSRRPADSEAASSTSL